MNKIRRLVALAMVLCIALAMFAGCGSNDNNNANDNNNNTAADDNKDNNADNNTNNDANTEKRVVTIATGGDYYPYTYTENDELVGFDIDLWNEIAERCNYEIEWVIADMSGMFGMIDAGQVDFGARQITITNVRKEKYDFTDVYVYNPYRLVVTSDNDSIQSMEDLYGKKIVYNPVSSSGEYIDRVDPDQKIERVTLQGGSALQEVALGRIDACLANATIFDALKEKGGYDLKQVGDVQFYEQDAYPCLKGSAASELIPEINKAMADIRSEGLLSEMALKWVGTDVSVEN